MSAKNWARFADKIARIKPRAETSSEVVKAPIRKMLVAAEQRWSDNHKEQTRRCDICERLVPDTSCPTEANQSRPLWMASWTRSGSPSINPWRVGYASVPPLRLRLRGDRDRPWSFEEPSSGIGPLRMEVSHMAHDLALNAAQRHAFALSRTLMVPITLFRSGNEFGVLPSDELDDEDDLEIVHEYVPGGFH